MGKLFANCCLQKGTHAEIKGIPGDSASVSDRHRLRNVNISRCWFKSLQHVNTTLLCGFLPACTQTMPAAVYCLHSIYPARTLQISLQFGTTQLRILQPATSEAANTDRSWHEKESFDVMISFVS